MHTCKYTENRYPINGGTLVRTYCASYCGNPDTFSLEVGGRSIELHHFCCESEPEAILSAEKVLAEEKAATVREIEDAKSHLAKREGGQVSIGCQSENDAYELKYDSERRERETLGEHHPYEVTSVIFWEIPKWLRWFIK